MRSSNSPPKYGQGQGPQQPMNGMQGLGGAARAMFDKFGHRGGQPPMAGEPPPGMGIMPMQEQGQGAPPMQEQGGHQGTPMQGMHRPQMPQMQTGMAGLGQGMRGMYDRARVNALRGGQQP